MKIKYMLGMVVVTLGMWCLVVMTIGALSWMFPVSPANADKIDPEPFLIIDLKEPVVECWLQVVFTDQERKEICLTESDIRSLTSLEATQLGALISLLRAGWRSQEEGTIILLLEKLMPKRFWVRHDQETP